MYRSIDFTGGTRSKRPRSLHPIRAAASYVYVWLSHVKALEAEGGPYPSRAEHSVPLLFVAEHVVPLLPMPP